MARPTPLLGNWQQAKFSGSTNGVTAAGLTDVITLSGDGAIATGVPYFPRSMRIAVLFEGAVTNRDVTVSLGTTDPVVTAWSVAQTQEVRTLPGGAIVCGIFVFDTLNATSLQIALESAITGGTAKVYYCFQEGGVNA